MSRDRREVLRGFLYEWLCLTAHFFKILLKAPDNRRKRIKIMFGGTKAGFGFKPEIEYV